MKLSYFRAKNGNFGDDLNPWLWDRIFEFKNYKNIDFLGIGSILSDEVNLIKDLDSSKTKVIFGTGVRYSYKHIDLDDSWDVLFLRGPLSSESFDNRFNFISDGAYCLRQINDFNDFVNLPKKYEVSFMPHMSSVGFFNWRKECDDLGINYISPYSENGVEFTLREIAQSKTVISEAMHGAIIADVFRVPWHRFIFATPYFEGGLISEFKWNDWLLSIGVKKNIPTCVKAYFKTPINPFLLKTTGYRIDAQFFMRRYVRPSLHHAIGNINDFNLSTDQVIAEIDHKLIERIQFFNNKYHLDQ